jgi:hypothetical protein
VKVKLNNIGHNFLLRGLSPRANYTERPQLVGDVSANVCEERVTRGQRDGSPRPYSGISGPIGPHIMEYNPDSHKYGHHIRSGQK